MITVKLTGGVGNQMFQYALGLHLAIKHDTTLRLEANTKEYISTLLNRINPYKKQKKHVQYALDIFTINKNPYHIVDVLAQYMPLKKRFDKNNRERITSRKLVLEKHFHYDPSILSNTPDDVYLVGYWQSPAYFADIEPIIRKEFTFRNSILPQSETILHKIQNTTSICLHVRRGDYLSKPVPKIAIFMAPFMVEYCIAQSL